MDRYKTMSKNRIYQTFTHREAVFRVCCDAYDAVTSEIVRQRTILEGYIQRYPEFRHHLEPMELHSDAPEIARQMSRAAEKVGGVGPMAAVAGAMAQCAAEAGLQAGASEVLVDNGGDIYLQTRDSVVIGLYSGATALSDRLAFSLEASDTPLAICSSSGRMGHSMSLGCCDLATVVAKDAALADAAATHAANLVKDVGDVDIVLEMIASIEGVDGVLIIQDDRIGLVGQVPSLVKTR